MSVFLAVSFDEPFPDFSFNNTAIENVIKEKILEIVIDSRPNFKSHPKNICKKVNQKLSAPLKLSKVTILHQRGKKW